MIRYGINGSSHLLLGGIPAVRTSIHQVEQDGFAAYWSGQLGLIESLQLYAAHGDTGSGMEPGTAVISTWERHPRTLAAQALTSQALTGGRIVLGIGPDHRPVVEDRLHIHAGYAVPPSYRAMLDIEGVEGLAPQPCRFPGVADV